MGNLNNIIESYRQIIEETQEKLSKVKNQIYRISTLRITLFTAGVIGIIYFFSSSWWIICGVIAVTFVPFLALVKYHNRLFYKKDYLEKKIEINRDELSAIDYDSSCFDGGKEYINPGHLYSFDLDLFGDNSLFQYINRTCTLFGKERLADWFLNHLDKKETIEARQEAVKELASELHLRQRFRILGLLYKGEATDKDEIREWTQAPAYFGRKWWSRPVLWLVPAVNIILALLGFAGIISLNWLGLAFAFFVICSFGLIKRVTNLQMVYEKRLRILSTYAKLISLIDEHEMKSPLLKSLRNELGTKEKRATDVLKELSKELDRLDLRNNQIMYVILEGSVFWQLRQVMRIEQWKQKYGPMLVPWLETLGKIDALCSLATFAYNHPDYAYPVIAAEPFTLCATEMGHPLMHRDKCVKNNLDINKRPYFVIITGANMAGKSTYLRTIGVNYLLACIGAPVCCKQMEIYPSHLITSLRTSDSLTDNESYFFAELKRLKLIIDKLNNGEELFIILDEILKGTNSMDKQKGSFALIKQFMNLNANGIIATHDLLLGTLIDLFPEDIHNYCFEADITNNELTFSYQLKDGIAQNMNACFLMKKMGIVVDND